MVILKNVKRTDNIIECDYFPENGTSFGHIALNINKKDFIESKCIMAGEDEKLCYAEWEAFFQIVFKDNSESVQFHYQLRKQQRVS